MFDAAAAKIVETLFSNNGLLACICIALLYEVVRLRRENLDLQKDRIALGERVVVALERSSEAQNKQATSQIEAAEATQETGQVVRELIKLVEGRELSRSR